MLEQRANPPPARQGRATFRLLGVLDSAVRTVALGIGLTVALVLALKWGA